MKIIRASEIGTFIYCQRAWWYAMQNVPSENQAALSGGEAFHQKHGRGIRTIQRLRRLAYSFALLAGLLAVIYLIWLWI